MKSKSATGSILLVAGLLILVSAFFLSLLRTVGTIGEEWRTVAVLESNPNSYTEWMWSSLEFGVLPIAIGLVFYTIDFVLHGKTRTRDLNQLILCVVGGFLVAWGIYYFRGAYFSFNEAVGLADRWHVVGIVDPLKTIYLGYESVGILWMVLGIFLSITSGNVMLRTPNRTNQA